MNPLKQASFQPITCFLSFCPSCHCNPTPASHILVPHPCWVALLSSSRCMSQVDVPSLSRRIRLHLPSSLENWFAHWAVPRDDSPSPVCVETGSKERKAAAVLLHSWCPHSQSPTCSRWPLVICKQSGPGKTLRHLAHIPHRKGNLIVLMWLSPLSVCNPAK